MTERSEAGPLWLAVAGKGGSGKSVIAGTLARALARGGRPVLAVDSDPMPGLSRSLGVDEPSEPPLGRAAERNGDRRWRLKKGVGPWRAVQRYSTPAPDGVRLLQLGKADEDGLANVIGSVNAFLHVVHRIEEAKTLRDWTIVGDLPAGPRHVAAGFAPYARLYLAVVEPTAQSALTARRVARIARDHQGAEVLFVANKVRGPADRRRVQRLLGAPFEWAVPADAAVVDAERTGRPLLDAAPRSPAVRAIERLAADLEGRTL
jgi:CO dehydrogenase maturation factor